MVKNLMFRQTAIPFLEKGLDVYAQREKVISSNIANANTPGYRRLYVSFEDQLERAMGKALPGVTTHENHRPVGANRSSLPDPRMKIDQSNELKSGVNNVSVEEEIVEVVKNQIRFMYGTRMLSREFASIRASIKGRFDR